MRVPGGTVAGAEDNPAKSWRVWKVDTCLLFRSVDFLYGRAAHSWVRCIEAFEFAARFLDKTLDFWPLLLRLPDARFEVIDETVPYVP